MNEHSVDEIRLAFIDECIQVPQHLELIYAKKQKGALVGSLEKIRRDFHKNMITEGWSSFHQKLQTLGAIVAVSYGISMINTDIIPKELVPFALEHEVIENTFDADTTEAAGRIIQQLGLRTPMFHKFKPNHVVATVRQLRLAQKDGKLDAMMSFADNLEARPENKSQAVGNKELRMRVYELLTCTPWQQ